VAIFLPHTHSITHVVTHSQLTAHVIPLHVNATCWDWWQHTALECMHADDEQLLSVQADAQQKQADDEHAAAEEAARLAQIRAEYEAAIPDEIKEKVQSAVTKELVSPAVTCLIPL
jgi:hypothetical protein